MRAYLACSLFVVHALIGSYNPCASEPIPWLPPFASDTTGVPSRLATLLVITNDDPYLAAQPVESRSSELESGDATLRPNLWCAEQLEKAYRQLLEKRQDLRDQLSIRGFAAGLPSELTGGVSRNIPSRAVVALCDSECRLLGLHVGVPDGDELVSIIEDAEEVATLRQLRSNDENLASVHELIAQRSHERLDRIWLSIQKDLAEENGSESLDLTKPIDRSRLIAIGETLDAAYIADLQRRFGVHFANEPTRRILLEQHFETRQPWCESLISFLIGQDFSLIWRDLVEIIWHVPPVTADFRDEEFLAWVDLQLGTDAIVLALEPPVLMQRYPWPPLSDDLAGRVGLWRAAHELALTLPFRMISTQQLALLMHSRNLKPIDIQRSSMARYVFLGAGDDHPMVVTESDSPSRFTTRLKRSKSKLVSP